MFVGKDIANVNAEEKANLLGSVSADSNVLNIVAVYIEGRMQLCNLCFIITLCKVITMPANW